MGYAISSNDMFTRSNFAFLVNVMAFQVAWVANIAGSAQLGWVASMACLGIHFILLSMVAPVSRLRRLKELLWVLAVIGFGWAIETALFLSSVLVFDKTAPTLGYVPVWLLLIWACFATTFHLSMRFFVNHLPWALVAGAFATISYASGVALNSSVSFGREATAALLLIAGVWSVVFLSLCACYRQFLEKS